MLSTVRCRLHISSRRKESIHINKTRKGKVSWGSGSNWNVHLESLSSYEKNPTKQMKPTNQPKPPEQNKSKRKPPATKKGLFCFFCFIPHTIPRGKDTSWASIGLSSAFVSNLSCRRCLSASDLTHS